MRRSRMGATTLAMTTGAALLSGFIAPGARAVTAPQVTDIAGDANGSTTIGQPQGDTRPASRDALDLKTVLAERIEDDLVVRFGLTAAPAEAATPATVGFSGASYLLETTVDGCALTLGTRLLFESPAQAAPVVKLGTGCTAGDPFEAAAAKISVDTTRNELVVLFPLAALNAAVGEVHGGITMTGPTAATKTDGAAVRNGGSSAKLDGGETVIWDVTSAGADIIIPADEDEDEG